MFDYGKAEVVVITIMYSFAILIPIILGSLLKNKKESIKKIPIIIIASLLLIFEIIKQVYKIATHTWDFGAFPLHYCSSLMIWFALASFAKHKTIEEIGYGASFAGSFLLFILLPFNPKCILGSACDNPFGDFLNFHTIFFHFAAIMVWLFILILKLYKPNHKKIILSAASYQAFFILSIIGAFATNTNYICILKNDLPFLEKIRTTCGQFFYVLLMDFIGIGTCFAILYLYYFANKLFIKEHRTFRNYEKENITKTK